MPTARVPDPQFQRMLSGFGMTFAEILYRMPDHPSLLQSFSWQFEDMAPDYPRLRRFLQHWESEIEACIQSIRVAHRSLIGPQDIRLVREIAHFH